MLKIRNLSKSFDGIKAVQNCSFDVDENSITALIGPNGAGKTTVFNLITGFIKPDKGVIKYKNNSIKNMQLYKISNLGITRTFQLIRLFPKLSITENLMLAEHLSGEKLFNTIFRPRMVRLDEKKKKKECLTYLDLVGLKDKAKVHAENLSYGQQKLVEIARVLATRSDLILLDEPVAGVNPTMREKIKKVLKKLKKEGKTILLIEHDLRFVMDVCDKIVVLDHGQEICVGEPKKIVKDKKVLDAYLGGADKWSLKGKK